MVTYWPAPYTTSGSADVVSDIDEGMYGYLDMGLVVLRQRWTQGARYGGLLSLGVGGFLTSVTVCMRVEGMPSIDRLS